MFRKQLGFFTAMNFKKYKNSKPRLNGKNLCLKLVYNLFYLTPNLQRGNFEFFRELSSGKKR